MTVTNSPAQLFDLKQRKDGAWIVWTRKSLTDLGLLDRASIEATRESPFNDETWAEFVKQPHFTDPSVWVIAAVYEAKPTVETVLTLLGVKRKPRPEGAVRKDARPKTSRPAKPQAQEAVAA